MNHLSENEIIDFVSMDKLDGEALSLAAKVNTHLLSCEECRKLVSAYQAVYDEFCNHGFKEAFRSSITGNNLQDRPCTAEEIMELVKNNHVDNSQSDPLPENQFNQKKTAETDFHR